MNKNITEEIFSEFSICDFDSVSVYESLDSLNLLILQIILEKYFSVKLDNGLMKDFKTINDALQYCQKNSNIIYNRFEKKEIFKCSEVEVGMPEMSNMSLSENWLLKYLGDTHWKLITKGFEDNKDLILQGCGIERVYPAFIRINYHTSVISSFKECDKLVFETDINTFENKAFVSNVKASSEDKFINASLISLFACRKNESSNELELYDLEIYEHNINELISIPVIFNEYRLAKKMLLNEVRTPYGVFVVSDDHIFTTVYDINPYIDINGVGLLYFASYPIISDFLLLKYDKNLIYYDTVYRDIFYFSNINLDDKIIFKLHYIENIEEKVVIFTSLIRVSDNKLMSQILTIKTKNC
ncbi:LnmK family bifunctional acyltransferase/decarboxylase [Seleniivibrio woodruffii]|uniref:LnmK family bifunctional acyltransferase/decarboxylase n=1 Tax=Seleniivibrio woodruffii TaxID=1078050 RepID=UPI002409BB15|nr:LnmK family bifunctional acyltransferase/decarboxylase [Seleniivibrio woodruffii]